jgi:hypothetical protein
MHIKIDDRKKREDETVVVLFCGKEEGTHHRRSFLLVRLPFLNERFDQKTFSVVVLPHKNLESSSHMPLFSIYYYEC